MNGTVTYPLRFCEAAAPATAICESRTSGHLLRSSNLARDRSRYISFIRRAVVNLVSRARARMALLRLIFIKIHLNKDLISDPRASRIRRKVETLEINGNCSSRTGAHRRLQRLCFSCNIVRIHHINAHALHHRRINITDERRTFGPRSQCGSDSPGDKYYPVKNAVQRCSRYTTIIVILN